jgi:hypothetical protein
LPQNILEAAMLVLLMGRIYEVRRWDGLRCHATHTKFHKDWFRHSKFDSRGYTDRQNDDLISPGNPVVFLQTAPVQFYLRWCSLKVTEMSSKSFVPYRLATDIWLGIATGWMTWVRFPARVRGFSFLRSVQFGSGAHPTSGYRGGKGAGSWSWPLTSI